MNLKAFWRDESGATAIEYGILAACLGMAIIAALGVLEERMYNLLVSISSTVADAIS